MRSIVVTDRRVAATEIAIIITGMAHAEIAALGAYVPQVLAGDREAWKELTARLEPYLLQVLRRSRTLGPLRDNVDDCRTVMVAVLERLYRDNHRSLRLYAPWAKANPSKDFGDWIRIITTNIARDHVTSRLGEASRDDHNKRMLNTLASLLPDDDQPGQAGRRPQFTDGVLVKELLEVAEAALDEDELRLLRYWAEGAGFDELMRDLGLASEEEARRKLRATLARLRRRFEDE